MALISLSDLSPTIWFDASDPLSLFDATEGGSPVEDNGTVARWEDKSGNAFHVSSSFSTQRPLRKVASKNGLDSVLYDGSNDVLVSSSNFSVTGNAVFTIVSVAQKAAARGSLCGWGNGGAPLGATGHYDEFGAAGMAYAGGNFKFMSAVDNLLNLHAMAKPAGAISGGKIFRNGTDVSVAGGSGSTPNIALGVFRLGSWASSLTYGGSVCEVAVLPFADDQNRQLAEGALAWKWGIESSLPNDHPYKNAAPRTGGIIPILRQHYAAMGAR
jgi:hypothetical protein